MEKSKIVVGTSAFILAIAGAFAFKASTKVPFVSAYTKESGTCRLAATVACHIDGLHPCVLNNATLWTQACIVKLRTIAE